MKVKAQNHNTRGVRVRVGSTDYQVCAEGIADVSDEHADLMISTGKWEKVEAEKSAKKAKLDEKPVEKVEKSVPKAAAKPRRKKVEKSDD